MSIAELFSQLSPFVQQTVFLVGILVVTPILWLFFISTWLFWRQEVFIRNLEWVVKEIRVPREVRKSPRAMEQVLTAMCALRNVAGDFQETYIDGEVTRWFSLEIVSFGGEVHYYVRCYKKTQRLVEAAFFSYYPEVEFVDIEDYVGKMPITMDEVYAQGYDMWAGELALMKSPAYPLKTYLDFEAMEEEKQFDPMSSFLEVLSSIKKEEIVGIQFLIVPKSDNWGDEFRDVVAELQGRLKGEKKVVVKTKVNFPGQPILPSFENIRDERGESDLKTVGRAFMRTPGETNVLKAIEQNLSKPAFDTLIRFVYFSPHEFFYDSFARRGLMSCFNQFTAFDMNALRINYRVATRVRLWHWPHLFPRRREEIRKRRLLYDYRHREVPLQQVAGHIFTSKLLEWNFKSRTFPLNTEVLATLFHMPTHGILTAPHIRRMESKKAGPPAGLAIYGDESAIERFQ